MSMDVVSDSFPNTWLATKVIRELSKHMGLATEAARLATLTVTAPEWLII